MSYETIVFEIADSIATLTLNRPDRLNAAPPRMFDEVADALDHLEGARVVVLTGAGRAFCSGADLAPRGEETITAEQWAYRALSRHYGPTMLKMHRLAVPIVVAVNGPAVGLGCSIALAGDFVLAARSAYFLQAFVNIGIIPDCGASWILPRLIGKARAAEMMMLGERIDAGKAEDWGLIYKCTADEQLQAEARALAVRLANGPTVALGIMRRNLAAALEIDFASALMQEAEAQRLAVATADAREGRAAFREKRRPGFKGK